MDFSELRVGHRLKCVREYELLPFKVDTEYEVVNVNDGRVIICEVGKPKILQNKNHKKRTKRKTKRRLFIQNHTGNIL